MPEVETIRRGLAKFIEHAKISHIEILCNKSFIGPKEVVEGQEITVINRRGKALLVELKNAITMMIHLRMTGQLIFRACGTEDGKNLTEMVDMVSLPTRVHLLAATQPIVFSPHFQISKLA